MDWVAEAARQRPDAPALVLDDGAVSYGELDAAATGVASIIRSSGSFGAHPVAVWGTSTAETVAALWGIPRAGVVAVVVDPRLSPAEAMRRTRAAGARGLWAPPDGGLERLRRSRADDDGESPPGGYVLFTSGSEGEPKPVRLTASSIEASVAAARSRLGNGPDDAWLAVLPLFHVGGLAILWRQAATGAPVVLQEGFDESIVADTLSSTPFASLVPTMLRRVLAVDDRAWSESKAVLVGGAAADAEILEVARERGLQAVPTYGMTETCSQIATPRPDAPLDGTVGLPLDGAEIRVRRGSEIMIGTPGVIEVRGPMVAPLGNATEGWFVTGDLGVVDRSGRLRVLGRADSVIVSGGENVHPAEVESALRRVPGIDDARVFGEPDSEWGARVVAEVVTSLDVDELDRMARQAMPPPLRPRRWVHVDQIEGKLE